MHGTGVNAIQPLCVCICMFLTEVQAAACAGWPRLEDGRRPERRREPECSECVIMTKHNSLRGVRLGVSATRHTHAQCTLCTRVDG